MTASLHSGRFRAAAVIAVPPKDPSPALRRLIERRLDSYEKLELILALRDAPDGTLTVAALARELQIGTDVLRRLVATVAATGLVTLDGADQVKFTAPDLEVLDEAAHMFAEDRSAVIALFSTIAMDRIRGMAARSFADSFKLRKKGDDDG